MLLVDMASSMPPGGGAASSSADFVRKLYSMLEDGANRTVVRWGNEGDTFVVLDNEAFTRSILPKHFKHSNFSSFVRQLNKYDFHKVKRPEDGTLSPYGVNASEFKHPEFRANRKDNLDSIRRKNPAPKKMLGADEQHMTTVHSFGVLNELATATQQQVQQLQDKIRDMSQSQRMMMAEISTLNRVISSQRQSQHELLNYLASSRRESRTSTSSGTLSGSGVSGSSSGDAMDGLPQELRQAREYLSMADREMDKVGAAAAAGTLAAAAGAASAASATPTAATVAPPGVYGSPMDSSTPGLFSQPGSAGLTMSSDPMNDLTRYPIYPVGQTVGIDPFHSDHINNIPYQLPPGQAVTYSAPPPPPEPVTAAAAAAAAAATVVTATPGSNPQSSFSSVWGRQKPKILLVEDDQTCSRIGAKFLTTMDCGVEVAPDGVVAVAKVNERADYFDLIFMDIIMPGLDGASATDLIRHVAPTIPVIAMTSNIKPEDVQWYAEHGMNGVLAKPFTRDGMLRVLKQHLPHLLRDADGTMLNPAGGYCPVQHATTAGLNAAAAVAAAAAAAAATSAVPVAVGPPIKFESTPPAQSPSTTASSWHSPGGYAQPSPTTTGPLETVGFAVGLTSNGQLVAAQAGPVVQRPGFSPDMPPPGGTSVADDRPSKRAKIYGHSDSFAAR